MMNSAVIHDDVEDEVYLPLTINLVPKSADSMNRCIVKNSRIWLRQTLVGQTSVGLQSSSKVACRLTT